MDISVAGATPRVLFLAPQPFFSSRGTPINVREIVSHLGRLGLGIDLFVYPYGEDLRLDGVRLHRVKRIPGIRGVPIGPSWRKIVYDVLLLARAWSYCRKSKPIAIHGIEEGGVMAALLGAIFKIPFVYDMDSCMVEQLRTSPLGWIPGLCATVSVLERWCIRRAQAVLTVCEALSEGARKLAPDAKIYQIEDFPLDESLRVDPEKVDALKREFGLKGFQVALYTGNLESYQGIDLMLRAYQELQRKYPDVGATSRLLIVGGELDQIARYRALTQQLGCADRVLFAGRRDAELMGSFMALADVLLSPREAGENTPLKIYTYMASGKAILATEIRSHTQVLNRDCAYLSRATPAALAEALSQALSTEPEAVERRRSIAETAEHLVQTRYSRLRFRRQVEQVYEDLGVLPKSSRDTAPIAANSRVPQHE